MRFNFTYFLLVWLLFNSSHVFSCDFTTSDPVVIIASGTHNSTTGFTQIYVLTDPQGIIVSISPSINFGIQNFGSYNAYALNYDNANPPVLPLVGSNIISVTGGCFSLTNPLLIEVCNTSVDSVCEGSGNSIVIAMNPNYNNQIGFNQYLVMVNVAGVIVSVKPINASTGSVSYTTDAVTGELTFGDYTVYAVNFESPETTTTLGLSVGSIWTGNFGMACASSSTGDLIQVVICCPTLSYNLDSLDLKCYNDLTGEINISNVSGGAQPYTFSIDNGTTYQSSPDFTGLTVGQYTVIVKDNLNCRDTNQIQVNEPSPLAVNIAVDSVNCFGESNGQINVSSFGGTSPYIYSWSSSSNVDSLETGLFAGNVSLTLTDFNGCSIDSLLTVFEPTQLSITRTITNVSCFGLSDGVINILPIGGTNPITQLWQTSGNVGLQEMNLVSGSFMVTITDANGCIVDSIFTITEPIEFTASISIVDSVSCNGLSDANLLATVSDLTGVYTFQWNAAANNQSTALGSNLGGGNYSVVATNDVTGCRDTAQVIVINPSIVTINSEPDQTICIGQNVTFSVSGSGGIGNLTYNWDNGLPQILTQTVNPVTTTVYHATANDQNGCSSNTVAITVNVHRELFVQVLKDDTICLGSNIDILSLPTGGDGNYVYSWSNGSSTPQINVSPTTTTDYILTVSDGCGSPVASDDALVTVVLPPEATFNHINYSGCYPVAAIYQPTLVSPTYQYQWYSGNTLLSTSSTLQNDFTSVGCHEIRLLVTEQISNTLGCTSFTTFPSAVCVFDYPIANFTYDSTNLTILNPMIDFVNLSSNANTFNWSINGLDFSSDDSPIYEFSDSEDTYQVCLVATSIAGCESTYCDDVVVKGVDMFYIPNTFTPNGDGKNEFFRPVLSGYDKTFFDFKVFDRWGNLIYFTDKIGDGWDGSYNSTVVLQDVYVWKISAKTTVTKEMKNYFGHVNLLR